MFVLLFFSVVFAACNVPPMTQFTPASSLDFAALGPLVDSAVSFLKNAMSTFDIPAMSFAITLGQKTLASGGFGIANTTSGAFADEDTIYRIGSLTKIFTVSAARAAIASVKQKVSLDTKLEDLIPFSIFDPFANRQVLYLFFFSLLSVEIPIPLQIGHITLRQLASHMSGLYDASPCDVDLGPNCTLVQVLERSPSTQLMLPPGFRPQYSNFGFSLLGRALEPIVQTSYENFTSNMLSLLGMSSSGFAFAPNIVARMAQGSGKYSVFSDMSFSVPCGGMYSSVRDMQSFIKHQITRLDELNPEYVAFDGQSATGLPWEMRRVQEFWSRSKIGNFNGFASSIEMIPELQLGVVVLTNNADMDAHALTGPIMELVKMMTRLVFVVCFYSFLLLFLTARSCCFIGFENGYSNCTTAVRCV